MKMIIAGSVLIVLAVVTFLVLTLIPQASPNPLVEAALNWRVSQIALGAGIVGAALVAVGLYRDQQR